MNTRKDRAEKLLQSFGILDELSRFGNVHLVGSYMTDLMASNDIDIYVENDEMSLPLLHELTCYILRSFAPIWYEAKEDVTTEGKVVWFHGFETVISGEKWNFDIRFVDSDAITEAERFCDEIRRVTSEFPAKRNAIMDIKIGLISRGMYSHDKFTSMDLYKAVLEQNIGSFDSFIKNYSK